MDRPNRLPTPSGDPAGWGLVSPDGFAVDLASLARAVEQLAGTDVGRAAVLTVHHAAMQAVLRHGSTRACDRFMPSLLDGGMITAFAITEPAAGSNPRALTNVAQRHGTGWVLDCVKACVTGANGAGLFVMLVPLAVGDGGTALSAVLVPADATGVRAEPALDTFGLRSAEVSAVRFDQVHIEPWQVVGGLGDGIEVIADGLRIGRTCTAAIALAVMKRCAQLMFRYASRREVATGRLIDNPEAVRRMSRIASEITVIEALLSRATSQPAPPDEVTLALKVASSEFAHHAADDAMQLLGWRGYVEDNRVPGLLRDVRFLRIGEGPTEALLTELGGRIAARCDVLHKWMVAGGATDNADRLRAATDDLVVDSSSVPFYRLGWLGVWSVLATVASEGSPAAAFVEAGWSRKLAAASEPVSAGTDLAWALPGYADTIGTLDDYLTDEGSDPLLRRANRDAGRRGTPVIGAERPGFRETVHGLVHRQIERTPNAIAVEDQSCSLRYAELGERTTALAGRLAAAGVSSGDVVGVFLACDARLAVACLAVVECGAALLVLNPAHPPSRVTGMIHDAGAGCVLVDRAGFGLVPETAVRLIDIEDAADAGRPCPAVANDPEAAAYVNFTSGSTGRPKAVIGSHKALVNELLWRRDEFGIGPGDTVLQTAAPGFDIFLWEVFGPLVSGARLVFPGTGLAGWNPHEIVQQIAAHNVSVIQIVPSQLDVLLDEPGLPGCTSLRYVFCGGEPLPLALARRVAQRTGAVLVNLYGPTETTIDAAYWRVDPAEDRDWAPIGRPIDNVRLYVVDVEGGLADDGREGELWIGGAGVAMGYLGDPAMTAARFRRDPHSTDAARVYRTGDLVRRRADGAIEFLGRMDRQVKVRGVRIEPDEIERTLCRHPDVQQAAVVVRELRPNDKALVAFVVVSGGAQPADLIDFARRHLPSTMVPTAVAVLDSLPRTVTGKVDAAALPPVDLTAAVAGSAPLPDALAPLAAIWEEVLGVPVTDADADFFGLGGHSLAALRAIMRIHDWSGVTLQMGDFTSATTLSTLGALVRERSGQAHDDAPAPIERTGPVELSPVQVNLWYLQQLVPEMSAYNVTEGFRISGPLDVARLEAAFTTVVERHEALRTVFPALDGKPMQLVLPPEPVAVRRADLRSLPVAEREAAARDLVARATAEPFDLLTDRPVRFVLATLDDTEYAIAWVVHHIAVDGWSSARLLPAEVSAAYSGSYLPPLAVQPADYAAWAARQLTGQRRAVLEAYWRNRLVGAPPEIALDRDHPRPEFGGFTGARVPLTIADATRTAVQALAREQRATPYAVMAAAYMTWLSHHTGQRDLVVGGVTSGRGHPSIERVIGNFAGIVPLRATLADDPTFAGLVRRLRDEVRAGVDHADLPFTDIVNVARPDRVGSRNPLFQAAITLYDGDVAALRLDEVTVRPMPVDHSGGSHFDLVAFLIDDGTSLGGHLEYDTELFTAATAHNFAVEFQAYVAALVADPARRVLDPVSPRPQPERQPLTAEQRRIWLLDQVDPGTQLCSQRYFELRGPIDASVLCTAIELLVQRHPALRTTFTLHENEPVRVVSDAAAEVRLLDIRALSPRQRDDAVLAHVEADASQPIDIGTGPVLRATILLAGHEHIVLGLNYHHIVADFWAEAAMYRDLGELYSAVATGASPLPPVAPSDPPAPPSGDAAEFWRGVLSGVPAELRLPTDLPRPVDQSNSGARVTEPIPADVLGRIDRFAAEAGVDRSIVLLAAWQYLLHRYSGQDTVVVGVPHSLASDDRCVGYHANLLPIRSDVTDDTTLRSAVAATTTALAAARAHGELPFDELAADARRNGRTGPLIEVSFVPEITGADKPVFPGVRTSQVDHATGRATFPIGLTLLPDDGHGLGLVIDFSTQRWNPPAIQRMAGHLLTLLEAGLHDPMAPLRGVAMVTEAEAAELRDLDGRRPVRPARPTLHEGVRAQAAATPDAEAVRFEGRSTSYAELDAAANRLTRYLVARGVRAGDRVALLLERTDRLPVAVLAVLQTGAAYLPIDPRWPAERVRYVLDDARPSAVLTECALRELAGTASQIVDLDEPLPEFDDREVNLLVSPDDVAYVIYTSGSTGRPKGVEVTHHNAMRLFSASGEMFEFSADDRWTFFHSIAFDFSVWELFGALLHGGCVVVVPYLVSRIPDAFLELLSAERITVLSQTPTAFRLVRDADARAGLPLALRYVVFGGEALTFADLAPWVRRHGTEKPVLVNMYGITEATVHVTYRTVTTSDVFDGRASMIGRPLPDLECLLLDSAGNLVPYGVSGELYVGGPGVAKGYLGRPELTSQRFVPHPFRPGERLYRSGDSARRLPDGDIEYLRRLDDQVQLRGFRIELGEIETALLATGQVTACHVMVRPDADGEPQLVAYAVPAGDGFSTTQARRMLAKSLPDYMLPSVVVTVESLPLTINGKIDRNALPSPAGAAPTAVSPPTGLPAEPPAESAVNRLRALFAEVLSLPAVAATDNFFEAGGDSMRALAVSAKATAAGLVVSVQDVLRHQTPQRIASGLTPPPVGVTPDRIVDSTPSPAPPAAGLSDGVQDAFPLAAMQAGMLFHSRLDGPSLYHDVFSFLVRAPWDEAAFRSAVRWVTDRHPALRTTFDVSSYPRPLQLVHQSGSLRCDVVDITDLTDAAQEAAVAGWMKEEAATPIPWQQSTPLRLVVHLRDADHFELGLSFHHALLDGWSVIELRHDLLTAYEALSGGRVPDAEPVRTQMSDFVELEAAAERGASPGFWSRHLQGAEPRLFPGRRSGSNNLQVAWHEMPAWIEAGLRKLAAERQASFKSTLLAAHVVVNARLSATNDVVTGLVVNGRPETVDADKVLGMFLNVVPLRLQLSRVDHAALVDLVFAAELDLLPHRRVPLRTIQRNAGVGPLFDTAFNYVDLEGGDRPTADDSGPAVLRRQLVEQTNLPLVTVFTKEAGVLGVGIEADTRLVPTAQVDAIVELYEHVLTVLARDGGAPLPDFRHGTDLQLLRPSQLVVSRPASENRDSACTRLARIWEDVLGRPMAATDTLRDGGGDSISALVLSDRIADAFGCRPPLQELLQGTTLENIANQIQLDTVLSR